MQGFDEVGLLAAEEDTWLDRSSAATLELSGELRESLRARTGEVVREGMDRGGGEENFLHRRGDLSLGCSLPVLLERLFWLVAKKSSRDLSLGEHTVCENVSILPDKFSSRGETFMHFRLENRENKDERWMRCG